MWKSHSHLFPEDKEGFPDQLQDVWPPKGLHILSEKGVTWQWQEAQPALVCWTLPVGQSHHPGDRGPQGRAPCSAIQHPRLSRALVNRAVVSRGLFQNPLKVLVEIQSQNENRK